MPNEGTTGQKPVPTTDTPPATGTAETGNSTPPTEGGDRRPPWERTGEPFDSDRAWQLIERLRSERDSARPGNTAGPLTRRTTRPRGVDPRSGRPRRAAGRAGPPAGHPPVRPR